MQAGRDDLQAAADKLVASGLFANVKYNFQTRVDGLVVTFHVEEAQRIPGLLRQYSVVHRRRAERRDSQQDSLLRRDAAERGQCRRSSGRCR